MQTPFQFSSLPVVKLPGDMTLLAARVGNRGCSLMGQLGWEEEEEEALGVGDRQPGKVLA